MYEFLRKVPLFADLPEEDLERLCEMIEEVRLPASEELFAEGSIGDRAYVIKEGQLEIVKISGNREVLLAVRGAGEVIGEMSLVEEAPRMAAVRARGPTVLLAIGHAQFEQLLNHSPSAARALLHTVISRWRATEAMLRQSEKMAQLGTLTAGLAHELNNPAAAVQRGAQQLRETDDQLQAVQLRLASLGLSKPQLDALEELGRHARQQARQPGELDALTRADLEDELEDWLDDQGMEEPWDLAPALVNLGYTPQDFETSTRAFSQDQRGDVLLWLGSIYNFYSLMEEIYQGAGRISQIVKSLKSYAYLDQAPIQAVNLHEGLDDTLVLLRNKLKAGVNVRREYLEDLPIIQGYGSELNQVWTNIIDNAIDAMDGKGELLLRTRREGDWVIVEFVDSGPGIPAELRNKVFDPFFTTKPPGKGTGMGLDISWNIVVGKHRGDIKVYSKPGQTCFQVWLPINFESVQGAAPTSVKGIDRPDDESLLEILQSTSTIAVVGISASESAPAHSVPAYLQSHGYRIIPVTPFYESMLDETAYPDLLKIPDPIDLVLIFRRSELVPPVVEQAIQIGAATVWMQEGIVNEAAAERAREAGLKVVMDTCMRTTHRRLMGKRTVEPG